MSTSTQVMFGILFAFGYLVAPIMLIWGWARWLRQPKVRTTPSILSLIGFILASASALIAFLLIAYAQIHHFPYYPDGLLALLHVQFRQTEDSRRLDRSYRGWHRRAIPCLVDAADVRSLNQTPNPSR